MGRRERISVYFMNISFMCNYATCAQLRCSLHVICSGEYLVLHFTTGALSAIELWGPYYTKVPKNLYFITLCMSTLKKMEFN